MFYNFLVYFGADVFFVAPTSAIQKQPWRKTGTQPCPHPVNIFQPANRYYIFLILFSSRFDFGPLAIFRSVPPLSWWRRFLV